MQVNEWHNNKNTWIGVNIESNKWKVLHGEKRKKKEIIELFRASGSREKGGGRKASGGHPFIHRTKPEHNILGASVRLCGSVCGCCVRSSTIQTNMNS